VPLIRRCAWARTPESILYHDTEWGVPVHDDRTFFEFLILEGAQAGLSWETILRKRDGYRKAFAGFDPARVARFDERKVALLMQNPAIVRNRLKIESAVANARSVLAIQAEFGSLDAFLWGLAGGAPLRAVRRRQDDVPALTPLAESISRQLRARQMRFVGPTIVYAFMQATGIVNDHLSSCFRTHELSRKG
jgi:DNA-3-methyladenine glycosylase I